MKEGYPIFNTEESQYLASSLGEPLIKGLTEVARLRPSNPVVHLANYLLTTGQRENQQREREKISGPRQLAAGPEGDPSWNEAKSPIEDDERDGGGKPEDVEGKTRDEEDEEDRFADREDESDDNDGREDQMSPVAESAFKLANRDEHGQTMVHFAAARSHGRNAMFQLLQEVDLNVALRDSVYRTPRDIAEQMELEENVKSIDKYIVSIAARGDDDKLNELILEGYDHILDAKDGNQNIIEVVTTRDNETTLELLRNLKSFEERREKLHRAIRFGSIRQVNEVFAEAGKKENKKRLAMCKNHQGRCSLHVAVLGQHEAIVETLSKKYPNALLVGDNLMRTPLHYAMGVEKVEPLSRILIAYGAQRVLKDLKGRQPSYYFMNKNDIQKLQDEEEALRV